MRYQQHNRQRNFDLIFFEFPTKNALLAIDNALYVAALARAAEASFLAARSSSKRLSTLVVTSSALTFKSECSVFSQLKIARKSKK